MASYCDNCGSKVYSGACVNCHEEIYIMEQDARNDEHVNFSDEFGRKVESHYDEIKRGKDGAKLNRRNT
jgi:hypothetical protein